MPSLDSSTPRHIAILGGGVMGASTLYYLASSSSLLPPSSTLTLIEAADHLAPGASGKSGGFLAEDWHGPATSSIASLSFRLHRELAQRYNGREKWGYRDVETLSIEFDSSDQKAGRRKSSSKVTEGLDWIDKDHVSKTGKLGGKGTTAQVTPGAMTEQLVAEAKKLAQENGIGLEARLSTYAKKVEMDSEGTSVEGLVVDDAQGQETTLSITDLVLATGPWTGTAVRTFFPRSLLSKHPFLSAAAGVTGSRAHSIVVQGARETSNHCLFTEMRYGSGGRKAGAPEVYARSDGTVYVCGGSDEVELPKLAVEVDYDPSATKTLIDQTEALSPDVLSKKAGAKIIREQACYLPIPGAGGTVLAGDMKSGLWCAGVGASCWGITLSLGCGKTMADLITTGKANEADISMLQG